MSPPLPPLDEHPRPPADVRGRGGAPAWRVAFDHLPDPCLWLDPIDGTVFDANAAVERVLGHAPAALQGQPLASLRAGHGGDEDAAWTAMARGEPVTDADISVRRREGRPVAMSASASTCQSLGGLPRAVLLVWRDVTRRRQAEHALVDGERRLKALAYELTLAESRERARIAQGLHDEIGQLLTMAHFKLDAWADGSSDAKVTQVVEDLAELLRQATQATRSATFELSCPLLRPLGLQSALEGLAQRVARSSRMAVRVEGELPPLQLPEAVQAVVFRVVRELALNAQKHAHAHTLAIQLRCEHGELAICVADDGAGFVPQASARDFTPEHGFGLPSADAQMQAIGGQLTIEAAPGRGTRATVTLPLGGVE